MIVWVAEYCIPYEGNSRIGVFATRSGGKDACEKHSAQSLSPAVRKLRWRDNETFSYTPDYEVEQAEVEP